MTPARWYCPPGVERPRHARTPILCRMEAQGGPPGAIPGGVCYGGPVEPDESGWRQHTAGHWFKLTGSSPLQMIRLDAHPRLVEWRTIQGSLPEHTWRVPVLVTPEYDDAEPDRVVGFKSGMDRIWTGSGWDIPEHLVALRQRLLWCFAEIAGDRLTLTSAEAVDLAIKILSEGQDFDPSEIIAEGWVSEVLVVRTLCAASDRDIG